MLEFAVLGLLHESPMHGYELRKRLNATLGAFRAFSLRLALPDAAAAAERGWITEERRSPAERRPR